MVHSVYGIANAFINKAAEHGQKLSHMQIQKLIYFANGYHLGATEKPMIDHTFEAWDYGPVIPNLYHQLKKFGGKPITGMCGTHDWDTNTFSPAPIPTGDQRASRIIDFVWEKYGQYSALQLSDMSHAPGSPWEKTKAQRPGIKDADIPDQLIIEYFKKFVKKKVK